MAKQITSTVLTLIMKAYRLHPCSLLITHSIKPRFGLLDLSTTRAIRKYCSNIIPKDNEHSEEKWNKVEKHKECKKSSKMVNRSLIKAISTIFSVDSREAKEIINCIFEVKELPENEIINIVTTVEKAGISVLTFKRNILIFIQNMKLLEHKLFCIKCLNDNIDEVLPLLNIDVKHLNMLIVDEVNIEHYKERNKIRYLADELKCSVYMLCELITKEPIILSLSFNRIKAVINILKEFNYEPKDIMNNLWIFKYSPKTIHTRSMTVYAAGFNQIKPWVIRSSVHGLQKYLRGMRKGLAIASVYGSHISLLCKKLNISEEEVQFFINRSPYLLEVQLDKIDEILDIVLKYGYSAQDILTCHRIFLIRTKLLEERLERLKDVRQNHRLTLVYCSTKVFENILESTRKVYDEDISTTNNEKLKT